MSDVYAYHEGDAPLLLSVPHDGWQIPADILHNMSGPARGIPDTDWHVSQLYEFARDFGASTIVASYSRYVVDLNRPADDGALYENQVATGVCPTQTFAGDSIYLDDPKIDIASRVARYWRPYHDRLAAALTAIRERHGYALLWDAHSIRSQVPRLFPGELPVLNLGTWDHRSCDVTIANAVYAAAAASQYSAVMNGRFRGGYITRHYGRPDANIHALQLELTQRAYMNESTLEYDKTKAAELALTLRDMLQRFLEAAKAVQTVFI